jgi:hypothetical protein
MKTLQLRKNPFFFLGGTFYRWVGFRKVLDVGVGGAYRQQGVALFECFFGRGDPEQADAPSGVRRFVGNTTFPEKRLDDRGSQQLR